MISGQNTHQNKNSHQDVRYFMSQSPPCRDLRQTIKIYPSVHDNSTLKYVTKLACQNPMSVSGRNWRDCVNFAQGISMIGMNVKLVCRELYDTYPPWRASYI